MPVLKNTNPMGDVDLPLIYRQGEQCLTAGEEFEVTDEQALDLLAQTGNYAPVDDAAKKIAAQILVAATEPLVDELPEPAPAKKAKGDPTDPKDA